jgi:hypothetical protein
VFLLLVDLSAGLTLFPGQRKTCPLADDLGMMHLRRMQGLSRAKRTYWSDCGDERQHWVDLRQIREMMLHLHCTMTRIRGWKGRELGIEEEARRKKIDPLATVRDSFRFRSVAPSEASRTLAGQSESRAALHEYVV